MLSNSLIHVLQQENNEQNESNDNHKLDRKSCFVLDLCIPFSPQILAVTVTTNCQSIGYGLPNFGLMYNPYTSSAWGYGLGPQYSTMKGAMASGLLYGGYPNIGMGAGMGGYGMAGLAGFGGGGMMPYGPYASYAFPGLLSGQYTRQGPYGRYPGSTGALGYGSNMGYGVYNGFGSYPGMGALTGGYGDFDHYGHRTESAPAAVSPIPPQVSLPSHYEGDGHDRSSETKDTSSSD